MTMLRSVACLLGSPYRRITSLWQLQLYCHREGSTSHMASAAKNLHGFGKGPETPLVSHCYWVGGHRSGGYRIWVGGHRY